jgi:hypothetical protein
MHYSLASLRPSDGAYYERKCLERRLPSSQYAWRWSLTLISGNTFPRIPPSERGVVGSCSQILPSPASLPAAAPSARNYCTRSLAAVWYIGISPSNGKNRQIWLCGLGASTRSPMVITLALCIRCTRFFFFAAVTASRLF